MPNIFNIVLNFKNFLLLINPFCFILGLPGAFLDLLIKIDPLLPDPLLQLVVIDLPLINLIDPLLELGNLCFDLPNLASTVGMCLCVRIAALHPEIAVALLPVLGPVYTLHLLLDEGLSYGPDLLNHHSIQPRAPTPTRQLQIQVRAVILERLILADYPYEVLDVPDVGFVV